MVKVTIDNDGDINVLEGKRIIGFITDPIDPNGNRGDMASFVIGDGKIFDDLTGVAVALANTIKSMTKDDPLEGFLLKMLFSEIFGNAFTDDSLVSESKVLRDETTVVKHEEGADGFTS